MTVKIIAPWTSDQVDRLNRFQRLGHVHPFTCQHVHDGADRTLVATKDGWICPHCDYRQDWAHAMMLGVPPDPTDPKGGLLVVARAQSSAIEALHTALEESVKLQSHYAGIMNNHDGGARLQFANAEAWIARLRVTGALK